MTAVFVTIDTEYDFGFTRRQGAASRRDNFARSIDCTTPGGAVGVGYQMDVFDRHGLKGVFFVDPMPALLWGTAAIEDMVGPIVARGHDVQLHIHTEWLELAGDSGPLQGRTGRNIKDFALEDQACLLDYARGVLIAAGAASPVAFRAGNYGANDDTLRALAQLGLRYDTSHCPGIAGSDCAISLGAQDRLPVAHCGVIEVPIGCIAARGQAQRHAQVTALSAGEMTAAVAHCRAGGIPSFTLVSHSFELLSRDRSRINAIVQRRFERFCAALGRMRDVTTATYAAAPPVLAEAGGPAGILPFNPLRTGLRLAEQAVANALYGGR